MIMVTRGREKKIRGRKKNMHTTVVPKGAQHIK